MKLSPKFLSAIAALAALGLAWGSYAMLDMAFRLSARAEGTVVRYETHQSTSTHNGTTTKKTMYAPVVEFQTPDGAKHTFTSSMSSSSRPYREGGAAPVAYNPANPGTASLATFSDLYMFPSILALFALVLGFIAFKSFSLMAKRARLLKSGMRIEAEFLRAEPTGTSVGNTRYYRVYAGGKDPVTGERRTYADTVPGDPTFTLTGKKVTVVVNPSDPKDHVMDLSSFAL